MRRRGDRRACRQQLHQALGRAGRAQQVAVDLGEHRDRRDEDDHVDDRLAEVTGADLSLDHRLRALVQAPQQRAEGRADDECDEERAHPRALDRGAERVLGRGVEALRLARLLRVALHDRNRIQDLGRDRARIGDAVLARATELANAPAEVQRRQHDEHQDAEHLRHHVRVGDDQHRHRAEPHHGVAQAHAQARSDDRLHEGGVGGQPRQHLAGLRGLEELGALLDDMRVDGVAQVGGDALAEPGDHVKARGRKHAECGADGEQREEVLAQGHYPRTWVARHEALVDQGLQRDRKHQRADCREHEKQNGQRDAAAIRPQEGQQPAERANVLRRRAGRDARHWGGRTRCNRSRGQGGGARHAASLVRADLNAHREKALPSFGI